MSLQVWLPLNGDLHNQGLSNITVTNNGATINDSGKIGKCYAFNTVGNYIQTNYNFYPGTDNFSIACWFYLTENANQTYQHICSFKTTAAASAGIAMIYHRGQQKFLWSTADGSTAQEIWSADSFPTSTIYNTWHHLIMIRDNNDNKHGYFYLDGIRKELASIPTILNITTNANPMRIGSCGASYNPYYWTGKLNDFRLYNHALSKKEAEEIAKGLVLHYKLNETKTNNINLIINGFGDLGLENWTNVSRVSTDVPSNNSLIKQSFYNQWTEEKIPIYNNHQYEFSCYVKSSGTSGYTYPSFQTYDIDGKALNNYNCPDGFQSATRTTLAQALNPGATKIYATSLANWPEHTNSRLVAIFGYKDSTGYTYADWTYTQNTIQYGTSTNLNKTNNTITLPSAYTGPAVPAGTAICQTVYGSTYWYPFGGITKASVPNWTFKTRTFIPAEINRLKYTHYITYLADWTNDILHAGMQLFDLSESANIYDCSGYQNNGSPNNISLINNTPKYLYGIKFNGVSSYVKCIDNAIFAQNASELTLNLWVKNTTWNNGAKGKFFSCTESGGFNVEAGNTGYLRFPIYVCTNEAQTTYAYKYDSQEIQISALPTDEWVMLTFIYNKNGTKTYINGVLHHTYNNVSYGIRFNTNARFYLGCEASGANPSSPYYDGQMNDFRLYYTALTEDQILELYNTSASIDNKGNIYARELVEE